jgi:hypothetical protein
VASSSTFVVGGISTPPSEIVDGASSPDPEHAAPTSASANITADGRIMGRIDAS